MAHAAPRSARPYRRHIIGLPLQRSLFALAAPAATTIGLPGLSSVSDFPARLDENGDLFLDRSQVTALIEALSAWLTPGNLELMHARLANACAALVEASENPVPLAVARDGEPMKSSEDFADRMALLLAYGILSKFVPDVLLRALADAGDLQPPPFPEISAGAQLMQDTFELYQKCGARNYTAERLRREWPRVPSEIFDLVREFCLRQTGFGPLAWDSPGYEDPGYVVRLLHSAFHEVDPEEVGRRLGFARKTTVIQPTSETSPKVAALRRALGLWLDFLERETWYVRRAFYLKMVPLLQTLAARFREKLPALQAADLLFLEIGELTAGIADPEAIQARRDRYLRNTEYLSLHGVERNRLTTMMGNS